MPASATQPISSTRPPRENLIRAIRPGCELRAAGDGGMPTLHGYLARFGQWAEIDSRFEGHFLERIASGAFSKTFREGSESIRCIFDHGRDPSIGHKILGPIARLEEDELGAGYEVPLFDTAYVRELLPGLESGQYGSSFRFSVLREDFVLRPRTSEHNPNGLPERTLLELRVPEFGPTPFPAYGGTETGVRSLTDEFLREQLADESARETSRTQVSLLGAPTTRTPERGRKRLFERSARYVSEAVWVIQESALQTILTILAERAAGRELTPEEIRARIGVDAVDDEEPEDVSSPVAVLPVRGPIVPHGDVFSNVSGATSVEGLRKRFRDALADESVKAIVLDVDSPGGAVDLIPELADEILASRGEKPIVAVANTWAASGAYWLASAADKIVVTPSGEVGSIGVISAHVDVTKKQAAEGIKTTELTAGKFKDELSPLRPLSEEARDALQEKIEAYYAMFVTAVAVGRGVSEETVRSSFGEGRMVMAKSAVEKGMADEVDTLEGAIARLLAEIGDGERSKPRAGAIPPHSTAVIDEPWDGPAEEAKIANDAGAPTLRRMYAWVDSAADPDTKIAYKFPHHQIVDGSPRAANVNGVRNALARVSQADIPPGDSDGVRRHLNRHLDAFNESSGPEPSEATTRSVPEPEPSEATTRQAISSGEFVRQLEEALSESEETRWIERS